MLTDGGVENFNSAVDELIETGLLKRLLAMTDGNPFFLRETVELLVDQAARGEQSEIAELEVSALDHLVLPQGVRDAIGRRLARGRSLYKVSRTSAWEKP